MKTIALALAALFASSASAQTYVVQHNGTTQFSAATLNISGTTWNFVDAAVPPPTGNQLSVVNTAYPPSMYASVTRPAKEWNSVFGHRAVNDVEQPFPGIGGDNVYMTNFTPGTWMALHFVNTAAPNFTGTLLSPTNFAGSVFEAKISTTAGDFSGPYDGCHKQAIHPTDNNRGDSLTYRNTGATTSVFCQMPHEGYLNIRLASGNILHVVNTHN